MDETQKDDAVVSEAVTEEKAAPAAEKKEEKKEEKKAEVPEEKVEIPAKFKKIVEEIENMAVLDLHELVKVFEKKFGVSASAVAVAGPASAEASAGKEEKSTFTVELTDGGAQKIAVIKVIKEALTLGLKDAKDKVDGAPTVLAENMKKEDAEALKKSVEAAGGKVTLK
jgi:large subunit ribosomal protein L7/L12